MGEYFRDSCEFRQANYPAAFWNVGDMALSYKRSKVVFANRRDRNVLYDHHLIVGIARQRHNMLLRVQPHPLSEFDVEIGHTLRGLLKSVAIRVFAHALKHHSN